MVSAQTVQVGFRIRVHAVGKQAMELVSFGMGVHSSPASFPSRLGGTGMTAASSAHVSQMTPVLTKLLRWQTALNDYYLSNPAPGKKTNDLLLSTGLRLTFGSAAK